MASIQAITKAKATGLIFKNVFGVEPKYEFLQDYVRVYYDKTDLVKVHEKVNEMASGKQKKSDLQVEFLPIVAPIAIKKILPIAIGVLITGYILGKAL